MTPTMTKSLMLKRSHQHDESETPRRKLPLQTAPTTGNDMHLAPDPHLAPTGKDTHANNKNKNENENETNDDDATNDVYQTYQYQAQAF
mmetsp:Transcript_3413/g.8744  ORF Transcript_3413/g.8744 Transcript_3413/m.8744 type:complete len:89 (+) Transcript_3413:195-461(+)